MDQPEEKTTKQQAAGIGTAPPTLWGWVAVAASVPLIILEGRRLVALVGYERTLPFARDFLPGAIAGAAMTLAAYVLIMVLLLTPRWRKWGLAFGIGWGALIAGISLWQWLGPEAKNLWYALAFHFHLTKELRRFATVTGPRLQLTRWLAGLAVLLALSSAKAFADSLRERVDWGILMASLFYTAFYYLALNIVARLVTPH
jgi:hypothetical protein